jgi:hypothetical protein
MPTKRELEERVTELEEALEDVYERLDKVLPEEDDED